MNYYNDNDPGLSPRVRGNQVFPNAWCQWVRSIPACAGEPLTALQRLGQTKVYPRVCGGTALFPSQLVHDQGLSPRVRGNRSLANCCSACSGSIPACAGEPE